MPTSSDFIRRNLMGQPNGVASLDANGDLVGKVLGSHPMLYDELMDNYVPEAGELVYCTDTQDLHVGDGETIGGRFLTAPEIIREVQNAGEDVTTGQDKVICTIPVKADCIYELAITAIIEDDNDDSNSPLIQIPTHTLGAAMVSKPVGQSVQLWGGRGGYWCNHAFLADSDEPKPLVRRASSNSIRYSISSSESDKSDGLRVFSIREAITWSANTNLSILLTNTDGTDPIRLVGEYAATPITLGTVSTRRIA